ncbi:Ig-like domain-containing protein [Herpetosiphon geysericola]|uniref:Cadherin-like domain-containing protein n=1 Tax=Herpetosiphon geysericola TaxID=70996 RepID=A0A0N8GPS4_9CHLR|nr:Ig-like domain-containing protein [Herpetosiphon geysericola]KPL81706.1 hypothetical protein SE18_20705 [Herpetosiphon geysericola]
MSKLQKMASLCILIVLGLSISHQAPGPVAAVAPQQPMSPGSWSQAFAGPIKNDAGYTPLRPVEWNGTLYAGIISTAVNTYDSGVGYWNGQQWLKLDGVSGQVDSLAVHQNRLYVAGRLTLGAKNISLAAWDGQFWTAIAYPFSTINIFQLLSHDNQLYVGGYSEQVAGQASGLLFRWDGTQWHRAAEGIFGAVLTMLSRPDGLYLGGSFILNGEKTGLLHWNGSQWGRVGAGVYGNVIDLEWANNQLYVSGKFTSTVQPPIKNIATWNGTNWNPIGRGISDSIHSMAFIDGELYALAKSNNFHLLHWDTTQWNTLSNFSPANFYISWQRYPDAVLLNYNQTLYAFGPLASNQALPNSTQYTQVDSVMRWNGERWESPTPNGIAAYKAVITTAGEDLYAASDRMYWGTASSTLAHLNFNNQWQSLIASGNQSSIYNVAALQKYQQSLFSIYNGQLYQAGSNTWDQVSNAYVKSLAQANNLLYVAGDFEQFNGVNAHNLVTWNGTQWQALNTPVTFNEVTVVEADANFVYISDGSQLARWNGTQWTTLATNVVNIGEIEPSADGVYIAGTFSSVAGVSAPKIAYWNGTTWSSLASVLDGGISDLEMGVDGLYVAGGFRGLTNGIVSPGILRWDGSAWHGLAGGVQHDLTSGQQGGVIQLAPTPTRMLMYGYFNWVGNQYESAMIAAWEYGNAPLIRAKADYAITYRPQPVTVNVLANDWSDQPSQLQLVSVTPSSNGTAVISGTQLVYTPATEFQGTATLTYTVRDPLNAVTATAQLRVQVWNHFPTLVDQERQVRPFVETVLDPLSGLVDLNGDLLTITHASVVSGSVTIVNNQVRYMPPNQQYFGDMLTYTVSDGHGGQQTARIKLLSTESSVIVVNDNASTYRPQAVSIDVLANDWAVNNAPLQLVSVSSPAHGTATISGNQLHYQPSPSFQGVVSVQYTVRNMSYGTTASGVVQINILNHVPTVAPLTLTVAPNSTTLIDGLAQANDLNGDPLTITSASVNRGSVQVMNNQLRYSAPNSTPFTATITYSVDDGYGGVVQGTISINNARYQLFLPYTSK